MITHYDALIDELNDPVRDPEPLRLHIEKDNLSTIRLYERNDFSYAFDVIPEKIAMIRMLVKERP